jgi:SET family sugar efflux transporter-like MFS transporter
VALLGMADSMTGSYLVLFASDEAGLAPLQVGILSSAIALGGIAASAYLGRRFDQRPTRAFAIIVCAAGAFGYFLMPQASVFIVLLLVGLTLVGVVGAGYPQLFSLAAVVVADGNQQRAAPLLRSGWSLAWAVGPLVGAALLALQGYVALFGASAIALLLTAAVIAAVPSPRYTHGPVAATAREADAGTPGSPGGRTIASATVSMMLVHCAMFAGSLALPLYVTRDLQRPDGEVGLLFSACALVEIAAAVALVWLLPRIPVYRLVLSGIALFVVYFMMTVAAEGLPFLLVAQIARGCAIAAVGSAGIQYFQAIGRRGVGSSTALFSNAVSAGSLLSGLLAGALMQWLGTTATLSVCGVLSLLAGVVFWIGRRPVRS